MEFHSSPSVILQTVKRKCVGPQSTDVFVLSLSARVLSWNPKLPIFDPARTLYLNINTSRKAAAAIVPCHIQLRLANSALGRFAGE